MNNITSFDSLISTFFYFSIYPYIITDFLFLTFQQ